MIIYLHRKLNGLFPVDDVNAEHIKKFGIDEVVKADIKRPRNIGHHRKYWAMLQLVYDNLPEELEEHFKSVEDLHYEIKMQTGHREKYTTLGGTEVWRVKSIAFDKMEQTEFQEFYDKAIGVITKYIIPGITKEDIINQLIEF